MAVSEEHTQQLEADLRRERVARRVVDQALRDLKTENERLRAQVKELRRRVK